MKELSRFVGLAFGGAIGWYCGVAAFIPFVGMFLFSIIAKRALTGRARPFAGALAAQFAQAAWIALGLIMTATHSPGINSAWLDVAIIAIGMIWLMARPGLVPVLILGIYQIFGLTVNIPELLNQPVGSINHKALTAHVALRAFALLFLILGYIQFTKAGTEEDPVKLKLD